MAATQEQRAPEQRGEVDGHDCPPFVCKNKDCDKNYLIFFTAKWCKPCRKMYPKIEQLRKDGYLVYVFDIDDYPDLKEQFKLESVPTFVVMDKRKEVKRFVGLTDEAELTECLVKEADQKPAPDKYDFLP